MTLTRHEQFVRDLNILSAATTNPTPASNPAIDCNFAIVARSFEGLRSRMRMRLGGENWLKKLPAYDPLLCQVGHFGTLDLGLRETAHTRMIGWLMDPDGNHEFGDILLRSFLHEVFALSCVPELSDVTIDCETVNSETRDRLDICMRGKWLLSSGKIKKWLVIVEAKVNADEGEDQCARYEKQCYAKIASSDQYAFVFLTRNGLKPKTGTIRSWKLCTFIRLMALFRTQLPELTDKQGFYVLRHYMTGVLKDLYQLNCGKISERDDIFCISEYVLPSKIGAKSQ